MAYNKKKSKLKEIGIKVGIVIAAFSAGAFLPDKWNPLKKGGN